MKTNTSIRSIYIHNSMIIWLLVLDEISSCSDQSYVEINVNLNRVQVGESDVQAKLWRHWRQAVPAFYMENLFCESGDVCSLMII